MYSVSKHLIFGYFMIIPASHYHCDEVSATDTALAEADRLLHEVVMLSVKVHNKLKDFP